MLWNYLPVRVTGLLIAGAAALAGPGSHGGASCWQTVPGPAVAGGDSGNLTGVSMPGPSTGWAVGFTLPSTPGANFHPLLVRRNGRRWQATRLPAGATGAGRLDGITALSPSNAWGGRPHPPRPVRLAGLGPIRLVRISVSGLLAALAGFPALQSAVQVGPQISNWRRTRPALRSASASAASARGRRAETIDSRSRSPFMTRSTMSGMSRWGVIEP